MDQKLDIIIKAFNDKDFYHLLIGDKKYIDQENSPFLIKSFSDGWITPKLQKIDYYILSAEIKKLIFKEKFHKNQIEDLLISAIKKMLKEDSFEINAYALLFYFALLCQKGNSDYFVFNRVINSIKELINSVDLSMYFPLDNDQKELYQLLSIEDTKQSYYTNVRYIK